MTSLTGLCTRCRRQNRHDPATVSGRPFGGGLFVVFGPVTLRKQLKLGGLAILQVPSRVGQLQTPQGMTDIYPNPSANRDGANNLFKSSLVRTSAGNQ